MRTSSIIGLSTALFLSFGSAVWFPGGESGALAQSGSDKGLEYLTRASAAFESRDYGEAATYIEEAMKTGLPKELAARATFMRAQINEQNGLLARALQDYSSALWMDTLSPADRKKASDGKVRVIAAMGLTPAQPSPQRQASFTGGASSVPQAAASSTAGPGGPRAAASFTGSTPKSTAGRCQFRRWRAECTRG